MKKIHYTLLFVLLASMFLFSWERWFLVPSRFTDFLESASEQIYKQSQAIDTQLEQKSQEGNLQKFYLTSDILPEQINNIIDWDPLVSAAAIYNKKGARIATTRSFNFSVQDWQSNFEKQTSPRNIFYNRHWYKLYPVFNINDNKNLLGFLVLELSLKKENELYNLYSENNSQADFFDDTILFLSDAAKNNLVFLHNSLSSSGQRKLLKIVQSSAFTAAKYIAREIDGQNYDIFLYPWPQIGGKIGLTLPVASIFSYVTFYLVLLSLFAFLFSLFGHPALPMIAQKRKQEREKRERIEEILQAQKETLGELKNQMHQFQENGQWSEDFSANKAKEREDFFEANLITDVPFTENSNEQEEVFAPFAFQIASQEENHDAWHKPLAAVAAKQKEIVTAEKTDYAPKLIPRQPLTAATLPLSQQVTQMQQDEKNCDAFIIKEDSFDNLIFFDPFADSYQEADAYEPPVENKTKEILYTDNKEKIAEESTEKLEKKMEAETTETVDHFFDTAKVDTDDKAIKNFSRDALSVSESREESRTSLPTATDSYLAENQETNTKKNSDDAVLSTQPSVIVKPRQDMESKPKLVEQRLSEKENAVAYNIADALSPENLHEKEKAAQNESYLQEQERALPQSSLQNLEEQNIKQKNIESQNFSQLDGVLEIEDNSALRKEVFQQQQSLKKDLATAKASAFSQKTRIADAVRGFSARSPLSSQQEEKKAANNPVETIRRRVFSQDNQRIFEEVAQNKMGSEKQALLEKIEKFMQEPPSHQHGDFFEKMSETYFNIGKDKNHKNLQPLFAYWSKALAADSLVYLPYHASLQCYRSTFAYNLPKIDFDNFYFLASDFIFDNKKNHYQYFPIDESTKHNIYFYKKFPFDVLKKLQGIYRISLKQFGLNTYLLAFYYRDASELTSSFDNAELSLQLKQMVPALKLSSGESNEQALNFNSLETLTEEFRLVSEHGESELQSFHCQSSSRIDADVWEQLKNSMASFLAVNERMIYLTPNHLLFFLKKNKKSQVVKKLEGFLSNIKTSNYEFPADGKNSYLYL